MPRPEQFPVKFQFAITKEMEVAINEWRRLQADIPNRAEAIRQLVERGLAANRKRTRKSLRPDQLNAEND